MVGTDLGTNVSRVTDKTSFSIPEDGSPITISTQKLSPGSGLLHHGRQKSQTSLLIEYFEASKNGDKSRSRPSVRVKVTPSAARKNKSAVSDSVQITGIGKDRKPSYTRRISLGNKNTEAPLAVEGTELSQSSESNLSGRPPVEIEVLNNGSDLSQSRHSRDLGYLTNVSQISSMPPDSMLEGHTESDLQRRRSRSLDREEEDAVITEHLAAPTRRRSRSLSRERITQKVMEKLASNSRETRRKHDRGQSIEYEPDTKPSKERRRRSSKTYDESVSGVDSSLLSSNVTPSQTSYRSGTSKVSLNNPKLLEMVEDTVKRLILPEINQLKHEQKADRNLREFEPTSRRSSQTDRSSYGEEITRRVSKSSSSPNFASKPKVVLNRYDDDPGEVLSRGDSERRVRKSSRESVPVSEKSYRHRPSSRAESVEEQSIHRRSSKDSHRLRDAAAAGIAGGVLTAAALRHHDSQGDVSREKRKKRGKSRSSRSRSTSIAETIEDVYHGEEIPPMPMASGINDSELTRDSILSASTTRPESSRGTETPIREVSRGSLGEAMSPVSRTPTRTPVALKRSLGSSHSMHSSHEVDAQSPRSIASKARFAGLTAAGLGKFAEERMVDNVVNHQSSPTQRALSPVHSVVSLRDDHRDPLIPEGLRTRSNMSLTSNGSEARKRQSDISLHSASSSPSAKFSRSRKSPLGLESFAAKSEGRDMRPESELSYDDETPREEMEEWFQRQHEENERYRHSMAESSAQESFDERRLTQYTEDSYGSSQNDRINAEQDVRAGIGANPDYVHTPVAVESAVASLVEPSMISSVRSSQDTESKLSNAKYRDRMAESLHEIRQSSPAPHETDTANKAEGSSVGSRWSALRSQAQSLSAQTSKERAMATISPRHSETKSLREEQSFRGPTPIQMGASGIPIAGDPMPEIGHGLDDESDLNTNPSEIQGPEDRNKRWSYDSTPPPSRGRVEEQHDQYSEHSHRVEKGALLATGAAAGALAAEYVAQDREKTPSQYDLSHRTSMVDEYDRLTPDVRQAQAVYMSKSQSVTPTSPAQYGDEGYASAAYARSNGAATPKAGYSTHRPNRNEDMAEYEATLGAEADDPFISRKHQRHLSGNSHGMASPVYDSATGKGIDSIQSKDVVALMDHLTVRDAQRNARDTEILVTLVRSAAEMRQEFEALKRFIAEEDKMIMQNTDRDAEITVQKVLGGPRPQPPSALRTPRANYEEQEIATKRKNVFKRALKGLSMRGDKDLTKIEDMLNQLLGDVEELKESQGASRPRGSYTGESLDSYEKLRAAPDSGYEPSGKAGTSSTPNQSQHFSVTPTREERNFHSGYDGRRGSFNRVSTVMEGDEDELEPHESDILDNQFENNEQLLTPTQELRRGAAGAVGTPPQQNGALRGPLSLETTPKMTDKQRKHKSNSSSILGIPKISRWSKTTASSAPDTRDDFIETGSKDRAYSDASRSSVDSLGDRGYYGQNYVLQSDDRLRSIQSFAREDEAAHMDARSVRSGVSQLTRTPSPLIPDAASGVSQARSIPQDNRGASPGLLTQQSLRGNLDEDEFDDPKYQAHRNSLLLQHPQPRPGPTHRHQTYLESQAQSFSGDKERGPTGTDSDLSQRTDNSDFDPLQWGSNPSLSLARTNKLGGNTGKGQPLSPIDDYSARKDRDDGPLVPQKPALEPEPQQYGRPGHSYGRMYYSSPLGSGHLLEPIEEVESVRYSMETDPRDVGVPR